MRGTWLETMAALTCAVAVAGCGSSGSSTKAVSTGSGTAPGAGAGAATQTTAGGGAGAAGGGAAANAKGDIPDSQQFVVFANPQAGYTIKFPEGWATSGTGNDARIADKDSSIHVVVAAGAAPTSAKVASDAKAVPGATGLAAVKTVPTSAGPALYVTYTKPGTADPVTGKTPTLMVDRYVFAKGGKVAVVDLATPKGVDNVDAFKLISRSFTWK